MEKQNNEPKKQNNEIIPQSDEIESLNDNEELNDESLEKIAGGKLWSGCGKCKPNINR